MQSSFYVNYPVKLIGSPSPQLSGMAGGGGDTSNKITGLTRLKSYMHNAIELIHTIYRQNFGMQKYLHDDLF